MQNKNKSNWKSYQSNIKNLKNKNKLKNIALKSFAIIIFLISFLYFIIEVTDNTNASISNKEITEQKLSELEKNIPSIEKKELSKYLKDNDIINQKNSDFNILINEKNFQIDTSLNSNIQNFLIKKFDTVNSRYICIVIIEPDSGKLISMVGYDKTGKIKNPCTSNKFPAASLFKIITAAAAIEEHGYMPNSTCLYNGKKHTLYKSQIKIKKNRYTNKISFKNSFAQSINPVFGKIGANTLEETCLENYAHKFGFNENINFEIKIDKSFVNITDNPYQRATIASGLNRKTTISPFHGALLSSIIANDGKYIEPSIIENIIDTKGNYFYTRKQPLGKQIISLVTSKKIKQLMKATIDSGTCRKSFRGYKKDKILGNLIIGGKTGSINSRKVKNVRYDWFTGFAYEKELEIKNAKKIAITALVAHQKYIGIKASKYARMAIKYYFNDIKNKNSNIIYAKNK